MQNKKNKRGDIPITILVIGVIAICGFALFTFLSSSRHVRSYFVGIGMMEKLNSQIEQKIFNGENPAGLYLSKNVNKGVLFWKEDVLLFSVEYKGPAS